MLRKNLVKVGLGILFVISLTSNAIALTFSDGTFNNADWRLDVIQLGTGGDGSSTATASQQLSDGNPGAYRRIINTLNTGGGLIGYHFLKNSEYNPSLQGKITSVDFSYDHKMFIGGGQGQSTSFAIFQGGKYFAGGPGTWADQAPWETLSATGLKAENFGIIAGNPTMHPDFSTSGAPILFGFQTANGGYNYSITTGIDNWSVNLHTAPPPCPISINENNYYQSQINLGSHLTFDYKWDVASETPPGGTWDVFYVQIEDPKFGWRTLKQFDTNKDTDWLDADIFIDPTDQGLHNLRFSVKDFDPDTDPTVCLRGLQPVPLPGALVLLGSGLLSLAIYRRKKLTAKN